MSLAEHSLLVEMPRIRVLKPRNTVHVHVHEPSMSSLAIAGSPSELANQRTEKSTFVYVKIPLTDHFSCHAQQYKPRSMW